MVESNTYNISNQTYVDIDVILNMMPPSMVNKINKNFINYIREKAKNSNDISMINPYIPLREQKLSEETEAVLALKYKSYLNEDNKEESNEEINTINKIDNNTIEKDNKIIKYEEKESNNFFVKIFNFIKKIFKKNK